MCCARYAETPLYVEGLYDLGQRLYAWLVPNGSWGEANAGLILGDDESQGSGECVSQKDTTTSQSNLFRLTWRKWYDLVAQNNPRSLISGSPIMLKDVLKEYNRNEFHHLYPKAYLKKDDNVIYNPDCLANLTFMSRADNNQLDIVNLWCSECAPEPGRWT